MNESDSERQISNQTATFTKIPNEEPFKAQSSHYLASIPEEPEPNNLQSSHLMPQTLIKRQPKDQSDMQFVNRLNKEYSEKAEESMTRQNANITFYPSLANRLLYQQCTLQSLKEQESKLKGELSGINQMITDLVNKKSDLANEYEQIIKERKCYKRLKKNLEQEYEGYLFMLDGDYCQKLDEETKRQRQVVVKVRKEVHALNAELSKPSVKDVYKDTLPAEEKEKEYYELQMNEEKCITNNKRKQQRLATILEKNKDKEAEIKLITKKIDKLEYQRLFQDQDPVESKQLATNYEELTKKFAKLKKIRDTNSKVKEMQFYRKVKESKQKELAIVQLDNKIDAMNEKLYKILLELDQEKELHSKASTYKEKANTNAKPKAKRTTSQFRDPKLYNSSKNKLTLPSEYDPRRNHQKSSRNLARVQTQPIDSNDDRPQLLMRRKKIYTELERNQYFKNIQNSQQEKLSRIYEFDNKDKIAISSYDKFQKDAEKRGLRLPEIQPKLKTDGNQSIIYNYKSAPQKKLNKRSIQLHNRNMHHLRMNRSSPKHHIPNYHQLCSALNRDRLLIEQDLQYDLSQLIYSGHS